MPNYFSVLFSFILLIVPTITRAQIKIASQNKPDCHFDQMDGYYKITSTKEPLSNDEKKRLLDMIDDELSDQYWYLSRGEPCYAKDAVVKKKVSDFEKETKMYMECGEIGCIIDWEKFKHSKIPPNDPVIDERIIDSKFGTEKEPRPIFVEEEENQSGSDTIGYYPENIDDLYSTIRKLCEKYANTQFNERIKHRVAHMLKIFESINYETSYGDPVATARIEKIKSQKNVVSLKANEILKKHCKN